MSKKSTVKKETKVNTNNDKVVKDYSKQLEEFSTVSAKIRYLNAEGLTTGTIAKTLGIRYQWVRNVLITPVSKPKA